MNKIQELFPKLGKHLRGPTMKGGWIYVHPSTKHLSKFRSVYSLINYATKESNWKGSVLKSKPETSSKKKKKKKGKSTKSAKSWRGHARDFSINKEIKNWY